MKRTTLALLIACGVFLGAGTALGATAKSMAREQAHHRLLKLALQDAAQHARGAPLVPGDPPAVGVPVGLDPERVVVREERVLGAGAPVGPLPVEAAHRRGV